MFNIYQLFIVMTIADQVAKLSSIRSFTYISASDVFPLIDPRYITTKREAERYLFRHDEFKTIVLRPGKNHMIFYFFILN